jgi:ribosomal protein S18 acetylase RimI-like enzyme
MPHVFPVRAADPTELADAFRLLGQHLPTAERDQRVANALSLVQQGELTCDNVAVVPGPHELLGALVFVPLAGAAGLLWPPQTVLGTAPDALEDALIQYGLARLRQGGAKLVESLLVASDVFLAPSLERNGFIHITALQYLQHDLAPAAEPETASLPAAAAMSLSYQAYSDGDRDLFHQTLLRTYEDTLDCPELNGVRTLDEIVAGHRAQGRYDPRRWWLALAADQPAGVLILADVPELQGWDLSYVGVVPEARGRGLGSALIGKALAEARVARARQLTLAVDIRNGPARRLYNRLGFQPFDQREVFLDLLAPPASGAG